jgi:hypothetical protein
MEKMHSVYDLCGQGKVINLFQVADLHFTRFSKGESIHNTVMTPLQ